MHRTVHEILLFAVIIYLNSLVIILIKVCMYQMQYFLTFPFPPTASVNDRGETPLSLACAKGHLNVTKYLVEERHCDPNGMCA